MAEIKKYIKKNQGTFIFNMFIFVMAFMMGMLTILITTAYKARCGLI